MKIYINKQIVDLSAATVVAQTKQTNDLASLSVRNANYTNTFSLPKTGRNKTLLGMMGETGNTSNAPYVQNEISVYSDTGECFIYNGWATIKDSGNSYDVYIVDGITDFYKAIENTTLADLGDEILAPILHSKDVATVVNSWNGSTQYRYILADYNGNTGLTNFGPDNPVRMVNIDYLVPSVNVHWLWLQIMAKYNINFQGSVFDTFNFKNLWMTFPKGISLDDNRVTLFDSDDYVPANGTSVAGIYLYYAKYNSTDVNLITTINNTHLKAAESATYVMKVKGTINANVPFQPSLPRDSRIRVVRNSAGQAPNAAWANQLLQDGQPIFGENLNSLTNGTEFEQESVPFQLNQYDTVALVITGTATSDGNQAYVIDPAEFALHVTLERVDATVVDFTEAFTDFATKDFINEIVQRFGLTIYKDKYSNLYRFLTLREVLQNSQSYDWSDKFVQKQSENYSFGGYAQRNFYRYNYNDKESTHLDSYLPIANVNLPDSKDVIKSKIYGPERVKNDYLDEKTNIYKLWDKQVNDSGTGDGVATYKPLDKRYYFMRANQQEKNITVYSDIFNISMTANSFYRESFYKLSFDDILADYYAPLANIINRIVVVKASLWLNDIDIANLDFTKLVYIKQLSNYFIINKVEQYITGQITTVELVRVLYSDQQAPTLSILITSHTVSPSGSPLFKELAMPYIANYTTGALIVQHSVNTTDWENALGGVSDVFAAALIPSSYTGTHYFRILDTDTGIVSNPYEIQL